MRLHSTPDASGFDRTMVRPMDLDVLPASVRTQLEDLEVLTCGRLVRLAPRRTGRTDLVEQSGVPEAQLLPSVRLTDLLPIPGVGAAYSKRLWRAGSNSIDGLRKQHPPHLHVSYPPWRPGTHRPPLATYGGAPRLDGDCEEVSGIRQESDIPFIRSLICQRRGLQGEDRGCPNSDGHRAGGTA